MIKRFLIILQGNLDISKGFNPDVLSYNDYYPFGQLLPGRHGSSNSYRYGFNGKEKDDELKGIGNSYDFGARFYDPRVGRWFARDPLESKYPMYSTYSYVANTPIIAIDPDGKDIVIVGNAEYRKQVEQTLEKLYNSSPSARKVILDLLSSDKVFVIVENESFAGKDLYRGENFSRSSEGYMVFDNKESKYSPENGLGDKFLSAPAIILLAHELKHAHDDLTGATNNIKTLKYVDLEDPLVKNPKYGDLDEPEYLIKNAILATEIGVVEFENQVRAELGLTLRTHYGGINVFEKEVLPELFKFGTGTKSFQSPKLTFKKFDLTKYNKGDAVRYYLIDVVYKEKWWFNVVDKSTEPYSDYGNKRDTYWPERLKGKDNGSTRLKLKKNKKTSNGG